MTEQPNLFAYGSLMFPRVWNRVVGETYPIVEARLYGYERRRVRKETYPGILPAASESWVEGRIHLGVDARAVQRLDRFEGRLYERRSVLCRLADASTIGAMAYVIRPRFRDRLSSEAWDPGWFAREGIDRFLADYSGFQ